MAKATQLHPGKEPFPGYRLGQRRGRGGFAEVWEARQPDGATVALKFLPCDDPRLAAQEVRAIQLVQSLQHPHLVRIEQAWCFRGYIVIAMELAEGSLLDLLEAYLTEMQAPLPADQVRPLLTQAAVAIDFLNTRQHLVKGTTVALQHCDIKPSNLLLVGETVKVCDFGLTSITTARLKDHRRAGTLAYAAPEVFQGRLSDWTDQYALAVSYCQLRGGRLPFTDTPDSFKSTYVRSQPDLSMLLEAERPVLARALAPVPQERWPSCTVMMAQLGT